MSENSIPEVNDCRPQVLEHFIGQESIVKRCKLALEYAWNQGSKLPHCLITGAPGLGKTELCYILSKEMGCELHEQLAQNINKPTDLHGFLLTPKDRDVVLLDEIHELPPISQTTLYRAMENQQIFLEAKQGKKSRPIKTSNFTIIGATTDPHKLLQPLRDRFKLTLEFQPYQTTDLEQMLQIRCIQLGWDVEDTVLSEISKRGKGTPRIALRLLESVKMTTTAHNSDYITMEHLTFTCELENIDPIGLTGNEIQYLILLYENNGSSRLNVIASRLSLHPKHISAIIEHFLIREGLVTKENSVRVLTQTGLEHIRKYHVN